MGLSFGFLLKMGEIQSHFTLGNEGDPRQDSETCRYFSFLEESLWITRVPLWIVYEVGNSLQCPKHIRSGLSVECPCGFRQPCDEDC